MEKIIKIGKFEIVQGICSVEFNVYTDLDSQNCLRLTHGKLYQLLENATDIKLEENCFSFKLGIIGFTVYQFASYRNN